MAVAQLAPIAKDFKIADVPVSLIGLTLPALTFALTLDRILNGLCRPFFGWVSDQIGRENTMCIALCARRASASFCWPTSARIRSVRDSERHRVLRLGRDLQSLPRDLQPTRSGRSSRRPMPVCCIRRRARQRSSFPMPAFGQRRHGWHPVFMTAATLNIVAAAHGAFRASSPCARSLHEQSGRGGGTPKLAT